jgi:hypothetical protein
MYKQDS